MPTQNLNTYYYPRYKSLLNSSRYFDLTLAADERDYDEEVVFSPYVIAKDDGNRLPIFYDLDNTLTTPQLIMSFDNFYTGATLVSKNYYNPNNVDLTCISAFTGSCDVGLTATDNGLYTGMTGQTLYYTMGVRDDYKFHPHYYDRRMKMHMVTGYTLPPNTVFSGRPKNVIYNIVSKTGATVNYYQELYGGFYQGFYKLFGYDYEVFPERLNKGWSMETVIKPRITDEYSISASTEEYLNTRYPNNAGTFFFFGTRAENKYYHFAAGSPASDSGYTRITSGLTSLSSCTCAQTAFTNANCVLLYPQSATTAYHNIGCGCGACTTQIPVPPLDPKFDTLSNALSIRFSGCPADPRICVKVLRITGDCVTTGTCSTTGITFQTGYTITEVCSPPIYDICDYVCANILTDRWVMVTAVFERYTTIEDCDLLNLGGLGDIRQVTYQSILNGTSYNLIMPPETHSGGTKENKVYRVVFDKKWFDDDWYRMGRLKIYVNGYLFMVIENFEEIIPRELNTEKEKQLGVPFNISWGGGTQGLHDSLIFDECSTWNWSVGNIDTNLVYTACSGTVITLSGITGQSGTINTKFNTTPYFTTASTASTLTYVGNYIPTEGPYRQDPELFPNEILSATTYSGLTTEILMEQTFGGTFMGGLSQFRMYTEPMSSPMVQHNFRILQDKFNLFNYWCPNCLTPDVTPTPTPTPTPSPTPTPTPTPSPTPVYINALAIPCSGEFDAEIMAVPSEYQNLDIYYILGGTNGECYTITGPTAAPATVTWNGLVYGQGSCLECPPIPTPIPCAVTHNFVSPTLYVSSTLYGGFTNSYSLACSTLSCLQTSACTLNGGIGLMYIDTSQIQVGTVFYGTTSTCDYYNFTGYYIANVSSNYVILNIQSGVVVQIISSC